MHTTCHHADPRLSDLTSKSHSLPTGIISTLVLTALALKALLLFLWPVHQDEFHYLSMVYSYQRGELTRPFMTLHVHLFGWLSAVGPNEISQVIAARIVMYILLLGTCVYLLRLALRFVGVRGALFTVLCYLCFVFTITNGASFRHDTPATFFFMFALYHFLVRRDSLLSNCLVGLGMAVSLLFTLKAAIYLPVFAGWLFLELLLRGGRAKTLKRAAVFLGALVVCFVVVYKLHAGSLAQSEAATGTSFLSRAVSTFFTCEVFPAGKWIIVTLAMDGLIWLLLGCGVILHSVRLFKRAYSRGDPHAYLLVLLLPLLSLLVYRNAYPYFFVFLAPTATLFCGYAFECLLSKVRTGKRITVPMLSVALGLMVFANFLVRFPSYVMVKSRVTTGQKSVLAAIHTMFYEPVAYIDKCSMVSSYPKVGLFMSVAGMRNYLNAGKPVMGELLATDRPRFLLANSFFLNLDCDDPPQSTEGQALLQADWAALKSYFIHHWGPVWVPGKQFSLAPDEGLQHFEIVAPGLYTVESEHDILIDGVLRHPGAAVRLEAGAHTVIGTGHRETAVKLRWGNYLYQPNDEPESSELLGPFY